MAPLPLSAAALSELNALCSAAQRDPALLHDASLAELRALLHALGAKLPAAAGGASAAPQHGDDDLRDNECVAPDTPSQEMGPSDAGELSEEVRAAQARKRVPPGGVRAGHCVALTPQPFAQAQAAAATAREVAAQAAADGGWATAVTAYTTAIKVRR